MPQDENYEIKKRSMTYLTNFINSMVEPLMPQDMTGYLKKVKIYWIKIENQSKAAEMLNDTNLEAPDS